jgi:signal transduction histidine kinase
VSAELLRVLIVEDREDDALLVLRALGRGGFEVIHRRVQTAGELGRALESEPWDVVIADYALPGFSGLEALSIVRAGEADLPFIVVSGAIGEETAVDLMKSGAQDYVMKTSLGRLAPAIRREIRDAAVRRARREADRALREANQRLRVLSSRILEIQESERRAIARELHDEIGQVLTAVKIRLQSQPGALGSGALAECVGIVDEALSRVRNLSLDLRPPQLDDLGLVPALRWYLARHGGGTEGGIGFVAEVPPVRLPAAVETACFRIAQEAVTNALRHAGAQRVWVELRQRGPELHLVVGDNGAGFDAAAARDGAAAGRSLGLLGMEERAALAGGRLALISAPGRGTEVHARFALGDAAAGATR